MRKKILDGLKLLSRVPWYPFLFGVYPLLALLQANIHNIEPAQIYRTLLLTFLATLFLLLLAAILLRSLPSAALFVSVLLILFFAYGHVYGLLKPIELGGVAIGRHRYLVIVWLALAAGVFLALKRKILHVENAAPGLNAVALFAVLLPLLSILRFEARTGAVTDNRGGMQAVQGAASEPERGRYPDIYYIILDAYARQDVLQELYGYDNSDFIDFLQERGFTVASDSHSNYLFSALSIGSSLNMTYIQDLGADFGRVTYPEFMIDYIHHSRLREKLAGYGYSMVTVPTGYEPTDILDADYLITPDQNALEALQEGGVLNTFEGLVLTTSALRIVVDEQVKNDASWFAQQLELPAHLHRLRVLSAFKNMGTIPYIASPKFVFMHIVSPHRPYVFGAQGEEIETEGLFTLKEIDELPSPEKSQAYLAQLTFITSKIEEGLKDIQDRSARPPIIILQSDHGPGLGIDWEDPSPEALFDRSSILNAFFWPEACNQELYPSITPVNSFRILFHCVFDEPMDYLPDVTYFSNIRYASIAEPWVFTPIEELSEGALP